MFDWVTGAIWTGWAFIKRFILPWSSDLPGVSRFYSASDATQFHDGVVLLNYLKDHSTSIQGFGQLCGEITSKLSEIVKSTVTIDNAAEMLQMVEDSASMLGKMKSAFSIINFLYVSVAIVTFVSGCFAMGHIMSWILDLPVVRDVVHAAGRAVHYIASFSHGTLRRVAKTLFKYVIAPVLALVITIVDACIKWLSRRHWLIQTLVADLVPLFGMRYALNALDSGQTHWSFLVCLFSLLLHSTIWALRVNQFGKGHGNLIMISSWVPWAIMTYIFKSSTFAFFSTAYVASMIGLRVFFFWHGVAVGFDSRDAAGACMISASVLTTLGAIDQIIIALAQLFQVTCGPELLSFLMSTQTFLDLHRTMMVHFGSFAGCLAALIYASWCTRRVEYIRGQGMAVLVLLYHMYLGWRVEACGAAVGYGGVFLALLLEEKLLFDIRWSNATVPVFIGSASLLAFLFYGRRMLSEHWGLISN